MAFRLMANCTATVGRVTSRDIGTLGTSSTLTADRQAHLGTGGRNCTGRGVPLAAHWTVKKRRPSRSRCAARAQMRARTARMELHAEAARSALSFWRQSGGASLGHPYLRRKAVPPLALRQSGALLLVPLFDVAGELWNLQTIAPDGTKRFQKGARIGGLFSPIGEVGENPHSLLICEGWATGATLHIETGNPVLCAMNCGNLRAVALAARERWPHADIVVCGDDDRHTEGNPGRTKAIEAAAVIGGRVSFPRFAPGDGGTDFNDMAQPGRGVSA